MNPVSGVYLLVTPISWTFYPDGTSDPLNATSITKALINDLDGGGYHPVSLVLNCENYYFTNYSAGADVLLQDACK